MPSVLLLRTNDSHFPTGKTIENLRELLGAEFEFKIRSIGPGGDFRDPATAIFQLRRSQNNVIHAFGIAALMVAVASRAGRVIFSPTDPIPMGRLRLLRSVIHRAQTFVCDSNYQRRVALAGGIDGSICKVVRPAIAVKQNRNRDESLRGSLGFGPDDFVLLAPGESTRAASHAEAVWATGILNVLDDRYKLLLWGRGPHAKSSAQLAYRLKQGSMVKVAKEVLGKLVEPETLFAAADACLITASGLTPPLMLGECMASAVPIISTNTPITAELLRDGKNALLVSDRSPRLLARRVLDLRQNTSLAASVASHAQHHAESLFSPTTFATRFREFYSC